MTRAVKAGFFVSCVGLNFLAFPGNAQAFELPRAASTAAASNAWGVPLTDVTVDPAIRYGRLANGMRYAIRRNVMPKGTASVRLHFRFGSIAEGEDERGLAHFIEHMAFNGTTNVAEGEMVRILERQGMAFGPDSNAQTGFDSTTYMLELPVTDKPRIDTALFLMREVASEVKFDPAAVQRERGVIESERRMRDSFQLNQSVTLANFQAPDTPYGKRIPIGTMAAIATAPAARMASLYRRYYRPELATLIIVGDIDPVAIEAQIQSKFGGWRGVGPAGPPLPRGSIDLSRPAAFASFVHHATNDTANITLYRPFVDPADTIAERNRTMLRTLAMGMFNRRLGRLASAPGSALLGGAMVTARMEGAALVTSVALGSRDGEWKKALAAAEQEVRRARLHGFTAAELTEAMSNLDIGFATQAAQANARSNQSLAGAILSTIDKAEFVTTPAWRLAQYKAFAPTVTLAKVDAEFRSLWSGSAPLVFVSAKQPVGDPQQLASIYAESAKVPTPAYAGTARSAFAYESFGKPGTVVADQRIVAAGVRTIRFANNVRLNIKKTDFEQGRVRFEVRMAGGQIALPNDKPGLGLMMSTTWVLGGTGKHSQDDLRQSMAGRVVSPGARVADDAFVSAGTTTVSDLATQLKLSAAYLLDPGFRPEAFDRWTNIIPLMQTQIRMQPQAIAGALVPTILASGNPRFGVPPRAALEARTFAEAKAIYAPIAASAPIEIGIVGDIDEAAAIAAVSQSFGAIPARAATVPDYGAARLATFRKDLTPVTLSHMGGFNQSMVIAAWPTDDDKDFVRKVQFAVLASVLRIMLVDKVREELGNSYGADVNSSMSGTYIDYGMLTASAAIAPDKIDEVEQAIIAAAARLRSTPVDADLLARARNPMIEQVDRAQRENGAWINAVARAQSDSHAINALLDSRRVLAAVTAADIQALAVKYLAPQSLLWVKILPAALNLRATAVAKPDK